MQLSVSLRGIFLLMCTARLAFGITKTVKRPYGPKMCWRLCHRSSRCFNYRFSAPMLSCHVLEKSPHRRHHQTDQERRSSVVSTRTPDVRNTTSLFMYHKTRVESGGTGRYKGKRIKKGIIAPSSKNTPRLVILPLQGRPRPVYLPYIKVNLLTAMYYVSKETKLLLVVDDPRTCVSYILYEPGRDNLAPCRDVVGISVDEKRLLVFTLSYKTHKIHSMTLTGKNRQILCTVKTGKSTRCIALDTKRKEIFIPYLRDVSVFSYDGQRLRNIYLGVMVTILTIDCQNGIIYFCDRLSLKYYWNNDKYVITGLHSQPQFMQVYNHDLYVPDLQRMVVVTRWVPKYLKFGSISYSSFTILH